MKRLLPIALALFAGSSAVASAGFDRYGRQARRYISNNSKSCKIENFIVLWSDALEDIVPGLSFPGTSICADPDTFLRTEVGGRVQIFDTWQWGKDDISYGSWAHEVNCKILETRSIAFWEVKKTKSKSPWIKRWRKTSQGWWMGIGSQRWGPGNSWKRPRSLPTTSANAGEMKTRSTS